METSNLIDMLISIVVGGMGWYLTSQAKELKRIDVLLNKTREEVARDYVTKTEMRDDMRRITEGINRLEDKLDKVLTEK